MDSSQPNSLQTPLDPYGWPDCNIPRIKLEEAPGEPTEPDTEELHLGQAVLTPDPPPTTDQDGSGPPDPPTPPAEPHERRERPRRPPRWPKLLFWFALMLLAWTMGSAIGAWGVHREREWGWR